MCSGTFNRKNGKWRKAPKVSEQFPEQVQTYWDFELNEASGASPEKMTIGSSKIAWFHCPIDGLRWQAKIAAIRQSWMNGSSGCPECHGRARGVGFKLNDAYPKLIAEMWDFNQNFADEIDYENLTTGSNKVANFICPKDGTKWTDKVNEIVKYWERGLSGCPNCITTRRIRNRIS